MRPVNVSRHDKGVFSLCPAHCRFITDLVRFFRSNFSRLKGLSYLIGNDVIFLLSACDVLVLALRQKELLIGSLGIAFVGTDIFSIICLCSILGLIRAIRQTLRHRFPFVYVKGNQPCRRHFLTILSKNKTARRQPYQSLYEKIKSCRFSLSRSPISWNKTNRNSAAYTTSPIPTSRASCNQRDWNTQ